MGEDEQLTVRMPVLGATDLFTAKLSAMDEHKCDFAVAFPFLADRLGISYHDS